MKQSGRESGTSAAGGPLAPKNLGRPNGANTKAASPSTPDNAAAARNLGSPKDPHNENSSVSFWDSNSIPPWALGLILIAGVVLAYQPAWHAGFIWDDDVYVTENKLLTDPDGLHRIWFSTDSPSQYFPLVYTTFRLERALWGLNPAGYHWVNILLHASNALLLLQLLRRLKVLNCGSPGTAAFEQSALKYGCLSPADFCLLERKPGVFYKGINLV